MTNWIFYASRIEETLRTISACLSRISYRTVTISIHVITDICTIDITFTGWKAKTNLEKNHISVDLLNVNLLLQTEKTAVVLELKYPVEHWLHLIPSYPSLHVQ